MSDNKNYSFRLIENILFGVKISYFASRLYFFMKIIILIYTTSIPVVNIWLWKEILNKINNYIEGVIIVRYLIIYLGLQLTIYLFRPLNQYVNNRYSEEVTFYIETVMMEKTSRMDLSFFDSAQMGDKVRHARNNFGLMTQMTWSVFDIVTAFINVIVSFVVVCSYKWWLGLIVFLCLIPNFLYNKKYMEHRMTIEKQQLRENRKKDYYNSVIYDINTQLEIKLNNAGSYLIERFKHIWRKLYLENRKENIKYSFVNSLTNIINITAEFFVLIISASDFIVCKIGIGDIQYNLNMVSRFRNESNIMLNNINRFINNNKRLVELQEFMAIKPEIEKSGERKPSANPKIEFCNVSFRYPNTEDYILKECSFVIEPYEKIGLIGLNGTGKSTIIKLIFRFYDPDEGCIKFDGIDLKEYDIYAVRDLFGTMFQDYVTYCLPLREIIALPAFSERFNDVKIKNVCDISGISEIIRNWEDGYDSVLGRYYADNGKDFSGGQWQLVGLARAYFKESEYMILDEPSAALDPIAEDKIFRQLYDLCNDRSSIIISHRLSNTTLADKILVLDNGHIIEQGSHKELLKQNGKYAHLFKLQAMKYKD